MSLVLLCAIITNYNQGKLLGIRSSIVPTFGRVAPRQLHISYLEKP